MRLPRPTKRKPHTAKPRKPAKLKRFSANRECAETLRAEGWLLAEVCETMHAEFRRDLFGFADVIAFKTGKRRPIMLTVQCCVRSTESMHVQKVREAPKAARWKSLGGRIELWVYPDREERDTGEIEPDRIRL